MLSFKINFALVFSLLLVFTLQAEDPFTKIGKTPPFEINVGDTSSTVYSELNSFAENFKIEKTEILDDTILPPCDVLFFKSGKLEYCKIVETTPTTITYKMCDYQDGPNIVVNKSDVHKIRYANGKEEVIVPEKQTINAYVKARKDPLAILSLIFGLSNVVTILLIGGVIPALAIAGLILGIISIFKIRRRKGELKGIGMAVTGIVICALVLILIFAFI